MSRVTVHRGRTQDALGMDSERYRLVSTVDVGLPVSSLRPLISQMPVSSSVWVAKNNRSKSVWTLFQRKCHSNQTVWPVIFGITGPICARALKSLHLLELRPRGHHDWPVMPTILAELVLCMRMRTDSSGGIESSAL